MKTYVKTLQEIGVIENAAMELFWERRRLDTARRFYFKDNIFFIRKDYDVTLIKIHCRQETTSIEYSVNNCEVVIDFEITIDPNSWASIITSMSNGGETAERYNTALEFHGLHI